MGYFIESLLWTAAVLARDALEDRLERGDKDGAWRQYVVLEHFGDFVFAQSEDGPEMSGALLEYVADRERARMADERTMRYAV